MQVRSNQKQKYLEHVGAESFPCLICPASRLQHIALLPVVLVQSYLCGQPTVRYWLIVWVFFFSHSVVAYLLIREKNSSAKMKMKSLLSPMLMESW